VAADRFFARSIRWPSFLVQYKAANDYGNARGASTPYAQHPAHIVPKQAKRGCLEVGGDGAGRGPGNIGGGRNRPAQYLPHVIFPCIVTVADQDLPMILEAAAPLFDAAAAGVTREWSNPRTGHSGIA